MKILLVEDDQFYSQRIRELLMDHGVLEITTVASAEEALRLDAAQFDAAVLDIMLPNDPGASGITAEESRGGFMTGVAVARRLLSKKPSIRVMLLSSDVTNFEAEDWASQHSVPYISKHK